MDPAWIIAGCALLTLVGGVLIVSFNILWEVKKNTLLTKQIIGRLDTTDKEVENLKGRVIRLETVHNLPPMEASL